METFFILGRNPELSRAELISYLKARNINYQEILFNNNFLILNTEHKFNIQNFGGIIKLGKILIKGTQEQIKNFILDINNDLIFEEKFSYAVLGDEEIEEILKQKFKKEKRKAFLKHTSKLIKLQSGDLFEIPNADYYFFSCKLKNQNYFGIVEQDYSYTEIKQRDMQKPARREALAISPRLAKILINLSQTKPTQTLLDPFCGVAGILQEAIIQNINAIGADKDSLAIEQAKSNLLYIKEKYSTQAQYKLINTDSRRLLLHQKVDAIATEPALGQLIIRKLADKEAQEYIQKFQILIEPILANLKKLKKFDAKIAITTPYIRKFSVNIPALCEKVGLQVSNQLKFPIQESRPDQFVSREIWVLQ